MLLLALTLLAASRPISHTKANMDYDGKFKTIFPASSAPAPAPAYIASALTSIDEYDQPQQQQSQGNSWSTAMMHNNWFMLRPDNADNALKSAATATDSTQEVVGSSKTNLYSHQQSPLDAIKKVKAASTLLNTNYAQHISQQQQQQQQLEPLQVEQNSFKYYNGYGSRSNGINYLLTKDIMMTKREPSYILSISKQSSRHLIPSSDGTDNGQQGQRGINSVTKNYFVHQWMTDRRDMRGVNSQQNAKGYLNDINNNNNNEINSSNNYKRHNQNHKSIHKVHDTIKYNNLGAAHNVNNDSNNNSKQSLQISPSLFAWHQDIQSKINSGNNINNDNANKALVANNIQKVETLNKLINDLVNEQRFKVMLAPLAKILDQVKYFCEVLKEITRENENADLASDVDDADDDDADDDDLFPTNDHVGAPSPQNTADDDTTQMMAEVQGRQMAAAPLLSVLAPLVDTTITKTTSAKQVERVGFTASSTATAPATATTKDATAVTAKSLTLFMGRGKKLKKKLKKLILPLLLAYKLKFMALIPLLIGGLTLLVGSTGLAGFFFALFLTVITLKAGGGGGGGGANKSIVINKEW